MMYKIFLGLGANIGDREGNIRRAIALLDVSVKHIETAPFYSSQAVGYTAQPQFLNTVVCGDTALGPEGLLKFVKEIERRIGRVERFRWGPREIDIDILFYGNMGYTSGTLEIPHPRLHARDFVLRPLADLEAEFLCPHCGRTAAEMRDVLPKEDLSVIEQLG